MWRYAAHSRARGGGVRWCGGSDGFIARRSPRTPAKWPQQDKKASPRMRTIPAFTDHSSHRVLHYCSASCGSRFAGVAHHGSNESRDSMAANDLHSIAIPLARVNGACVSTRHALAASSAAARCGRGLGLLSGRSLPLASNGGGRRQLSTPPRGFPPRRTLPEKLFAGAVVVVLAAWGLVFGAVTLVLLPFVAIGLFLLRRNFQRGGVSRDLAASLARKMAERGGQYPAGGGAGPMGQWMQKAPTEGFLSSVLSRMLGGGIRGIQLVGVLRSEVKKRALRHPGLSSALGGEIKAFSDVEMSTVGTSGGTFAPRDGGRSGAPSRVIKARLRFVGRRAGAGATGWAEVEVSDWEDEKGADGTDGMEYDRIVVTMDNGKVFDLTRDFSGGKTAFSRGQGSSGRVKGRGKGSKIADDGRPVEAEFRNK